MDMTGWIFLGGFVVGALVTAVGMAFGYWLGGRN